MTSIDDATCTAGYGTRVNSGGTGLVAWAQQLSKYFYQSIVKKKVKITKAVNFIENVNNEILITNNLYFISIFSIIAYFKLNAMFLEKPSVIQCGFGAKTGALPFIR